MNGKECLVSRELEARVVTAVQPSQDPLAIALAELTALHERESVVLRTMDRDAIDAITTEKNALCEQLRALVAKYPPQGRHHAAFEKLRRQATLNQLLAVHARDAVRSILAHASGTPLEPVPSHRKAAVQDGLRLNVRG